MANKVLVVALIVTFAGFAGVAAGVCLRTMGAEPSVALAASGATFVALVGVGFLIANYLRA
ncbi:hypothetical protein OG730_23955 [Streptomyces sp. NBC_01298]|uniref:hypothetical protein n=1 Tax=Streptomyces sp. NBC_01298 TaxID=2903817 RepID=UPI002E0DA05A|nr:hypothetical protein OG730_23955 [Streptomyces sp. NBC_01298]